MTAVGEISLLFFRMSIGVVSPLDGGRKDTPISSPDGVVLCCAAGRSVFCLVLVWMVQVGYWGSG